MKIVRVESWAVTMRLTHPYEISYETYESAANVFVRVVTESMVGLGCAAPDRHVTGETADSVLLAIRKVAEPILIGSDSARWSLLLERIRPEIRPDRAARAAIDMALFDLLAKRAGLPLWKVLGCFHDSMETSVTIGILSAEETVRWARVWVERGFRCLKIKGGQDVDADVERILRVRAAVGADVELRFDANQGYGLEQALRFIDRSRDARIELLEQPTPREQLELLGSVTRQVHVPVMADESMVTLRDAFRLARDGLVDMVNVKLMKVGGISEALQVDGVARSSGLPVMVGCMDESALAIAAGLHSALARPNVTHADLDGHLGLEGDPAEGAVRLERGRLYANERPGLGFDLRD